MKFNYLYKGLFILVPLSIIVTITLVSHADSNDTECINKYQSATVEVFDVTDNSIGSGFIIRNNYNNLGLIVTNEHVILGDHKGNSTYIIKFYDSTTTEANLYAEDKKHDIAVLSVNTNKIPSNINVVQFDSNINPQVGDDLLNISSPLGVPKHIFKGIYSQPHVTFAEDQSPFADIDVIMSTASSYSGSSGGLQLDESIGCKPFGIIVGSDAYNTHQIDDTNNSNSSAVNIDVEAEDMALTIPWDIVSNTLNYLIQKQIVPQASVGIKSVRELNEDEKKKLSNNSKEYLVNSYGVVITGIDPNSQLTSSIHTGDILLSINNTRILSVDDYNAVLNRLQLGWDIEITSATINDKAIDTHTTTLNNNNLSTNWDQKQTTVHAYSEYKTDESNTDTTHSSSQTSIDDPNKYLSSFVGNTNELHSKISRIKGHITNTQTR